MKHLQDFLSAIDMARIGSTQYMYTLPHKAMTLTQARPVCRRKYDNEWAPFFKGPMQTSQKNDHFFMLCLEYSWWKK